MGSLEACRSADRTQAMIHIAILCAQAMPNIAILDYGHYSCHWTMNIHLPICLRVPLGSYHCVPAMCSRYSVMVIGRKIIAISVGIKL